MAFLTLENGTRKQQSNEDKDSYPYYGFLFQLQQAVQEWKDQEVINSTHQNLFLINIHNTRYDF